MPTTAPIPLLPGLLLTLLCDLISHHPASGCTTIAVGKDATVDGSVLCSHSNDGEGTTDPRLVLIPASDWPSGSVRSVFYSPESFPRYVGTDRASAPIEAYRPGVGDNDRTPFELICSIPQVDRTYQYYEETYGAHNERQLGIAESTCSGVFGAAPRGIAYPGYGEGKACFSIDALTQIAMERHHRARDAIHEIGALAERHGFYGAGLFEGTAESLIVTDVVEAWVFHILPDPTGASAIWAAQRVPDDSFAVVPNAFIIREIDPNDNDNFMYSQSVFDVAKELGWWDPDGGGLLDFTAQYSDGEYASKYYSGRRSWGVYNLFAPSLKLPPDYEEWRLSKPYPFAARPDTEIGLEDVARAMRSFYEGTEYSQAGETSAGLNLAGGPWKSPDHVAGKNSTAMPSLAPDNNGPNNDDDEPTSVKKAGASVGNWERTIGLYRSSDTYISQSRGWLPDSHGGVLWFAPYAAPYSVYVPFAAGMKALPKATLGHHMRLDKATLFWAFRYIGNYVQLRWTEMMKEVIDFQRQMMEENLKLQAHVDASMKDGRSGDDDILNLYAENAAKTVERTWDLCDHLMFKFADGQVHSTPQSPLAGTSTPPRAYDAKGVTTEEAAVVDKPGYPGDWLAAVGFPGGPPPPPDCADLDWKCGHRPKEGMGDDDIVSGKDIAVAASTTATSAPDLAWIEYSRQKKAAAGIGTSSCATRGDVAAVGKCPFRSRSADAGEVRNPPATTVSTN